jgi:raffinose/stachyose/melibiose transport system permease protein
VATEVNTPAVAAPRIRTRRPHRIPEGGRVNWGLTIIVAICSLTILIPLYFAIAMALKSPAQTGTGTGFNFPWPIHWGNFRAAWDLTNTPLAFSMSLLVTVIAVTGEILVSSLAAWAIVRNWGHWQFRATFVYLLLALFIPFPVVALPQVKLMAAIGLDNPFGVGILHIMFQLAFNVLLFSAFIRSIPVELEESARMDGCTTWQTFRKVVLPLLAPIAATVGIFAFLQSWNDFMMHHGEPEVPDPPGHPVPVPGPVHHQLQRGLRVVSHGLAPDPRRLPHRPALGRQRHHARLDQVTDPPTSSGPRPPNRRGPDDHPARQNPGHLVHICRPWRSASCALPAPRARLATGAALPTPNGGGRRWCTRSTRAASPTPTGTA